MQGVSQEPPPTRGATIRRERGGGAHPLRHEAADPGSVGHPWWVGLAPTTAGGADRRKADTDNKREAKRKVALRL